MVTVLLAGCQEDGVTVNEKETITTVTVTLKPKTGATLTLRWDDLNFNSAVDAGEVTPTPALLANTTYAATIELLNKSNESILNVSDEVRSEASDHIVCFTASNIIVGFSGFDKDYNKLRLGLTSSWKTTVAGSGTVNIKLRHQPRVKTGDCPLPGDAAAGETDVEVTFNVMVANPV